LPAAAPDLQEVSLYPLVAGCFVAASLLGRVPSGYWPIAPERAVRWLRVSGSPWSIC
jgi:hypothetical protein